VGNVGQPGHVSVSGGTYEVCGSGGDIWGTADAFQFARRAWTGDVEITARVVGLDPTDAWAKAGVMVRETLQPDARFAMTVVTPANGASFQYRTDPGQPAGLSDGIAVSAPYWVRLRRTGNHFVGSASPDGQDWTEIGSMSISMAASVEIGLCVTAHNNSALACAEFDSLTIEAPGGSLEIHSPVERIVYQRNNSNQASIPIRGSCPAGAVVEARVLPRVAGQGVATPWTAIDASGGSFDGHLTVQGGWYRLEVRAAGLLATVERVGVGEVFVVVGHSVAHGSENNIPGASDDRVNTIPMDNTSELFTNYNNTGQAQYLHTAFGHYGSGVQPAPYGYGAYIWSKFAEHIVQRRNVPVLLYNAAFGGTSLEHWAKASQGIWFDHGFVNASIRMPYINLYNVLKSYAPRTGIRAVLSDQGQNDYGQPDANVILGNYQTWVNQARADLGHGSLAIVVNRQNPFYSYPQVRTAQEQMAASPSCFPGPDYDTMLPEDRYDGIHLSLAGQTKAAGMWADALNDAFFASSLPWLP
jgi:hypothetical protein